MEKFKIAFNVVFISLAGFIVVLTLLSHIQIFGLKSLVVYTGSMKPAIEAGDVILISQKPIWQIGSHDVIAFKDPNDVSRTITHRIAAFRYEKDEPIFYTQGDANNVIDNWKVKSSMVLGKVVGRVPKVGFLTDLIRKPQGYIVFVVVPGLYLIVSEAFHIWTYIRNLEKARQDYADQPQVFA